MSTLHTVNKSPFRTATLLQCVRRCQPGDAVLLIEDGVYGAIAGTDLATAVKAASDGVAIHVLDGDLRARGIDESKVPADVRRVDYGGFVDLVAEHDRTVSWL